MRHFHSERASVLLSDALGESWRDFIPGPDALRRCAFVITTQMYDQDGDLTGQEMTRQDVLDVRAAVARLDHKLERLQQRFDDSARSARIGAEEAAEVEAQEFFTYESEGAADQVATLGEFRKSLGPIMKYFYQDRLKSSGWHRHVAPLYKVFLEVMDTTLPGKHWGTSPDSPAIRFIKAAVGEIRAYEGTNGRVVMPPPSDRSVAEALSKGKAQRRGGPAVRLKTRKASAGE